MYVKYENNLTRNKEVIRAVLVYLRACIHAWMQASGEAQYISDHPALSNELAAAFVLSTLVCAHTYKHS